MTGLDMRKYVLDDAYTPPTPDEAREAALTVCDLAGDVEQARVLVDMLGLRELM